MALSMDQLMPLMEASALLDEVEAALRKARKNEAADSLLKLQQDAGIELEKEFGIYDPTAGPETAALDKAYKEITPKRLGDVLQKAYDALPQGRLKSDLGTLKKELLPETPQAAPVPHKLRR